MRHPPATTLTTAALLVLTLAACAPHHTSIAAPSVTAPSVAATQTKGASTAATRHSTPAATGSATTHPTGTNPVEAYLQVARSAYPTAADQTLMITARHICTLHARGSSTDDLIGDLASHLGNQALAHRLITTAITAYCP